MAKQGGTKQKSMIDQQGKVGECLTSWRYREEVALKLLFQETWYIRK